MTRFRRRLAEEYCWGFSVGLIVGLLIATLVVGVILVGFQ